MVYIAYGKKENLAKPAKRLVVRGLELIGIYFLYSGLKFYLFNFSQEPFYNQFISNQIFNLKNIFSLKSFDVPISIILTIGFFLIISPLLLYLGQKFKYPKTIIFLTIVILLIINYALPLPVNPLTDFLYAKNNVMFPLALWLVPFLVGFLLAMFGLEKRKGIFLILFSLLTALLYFYPGISGEWFRINSQMYSLKPYFIAFSFAFMYLLFYLFWLLERFKNKIINTVLSQIRVLGDFTLSVYIYHWLVIDITLWLFYPAAKFIWLTVPIFIVTFLFIKIKTVRIYYSELTEAMR